MAVKDPLPVRAVRPLPPGAKPGSTRASAAPRLYERARTRSILMRRRLNELTARLAQYTHELHRRD